jgi:hypothetical protein
MTLSDIFIEVFEKRFIKKEATEKQRELIDEMLRYSLVINILKNEGRTKGELSALSDMYEKLDKAEAELGKTLED